MKYQVILCDPPWSYPSLGKFKGAGHHYDLMSDDDILNLEIPLDSPGVLFLWATCPRLDFAITCLEQWDLYYRGVAFVWVKTRKDGKPIGAQGVKAAIVKPLVELCLVACTQRTGRALPIEDQSVVQTIFAPKREHSRKPDEVIQRIDQLYPGIRKLEMFSRGEPANDLWDVHGDQSKPRQEKWDWTDVPGHPDSHIHVGPLCYGEPIPFPRYEKES